MSKKGREAFLVGGNLVKTNLNRLIQGQRSDRKPSMGENQKKKAFRQLRPSGLAVECIQEVVLVRSFQEVSGGGW